MTGMDEIAQKVAKTFIARTITLATSESLTGGLIGATLTNIPGSSAYYLGGAIAYAVAAKSQLSGVDPDVTGEFGVVSEQTVTEMALGIQRITGADWAVAVSGVAGPGAQEGHQPGEVWICVADPRIGTVQPAPQAHRDRFVGDREAIREQTVVAALELLLRFMSPL